MPLPNTPPNAPRTDTLAADAADATDATDATDKLLEFSVGPGVNLTGEQALAFFDFVARSAPNSCISPDAWRHGKHTVIKFIQPLLHHPLDSGAQEPGAKEDPRSQEPAARKSGARSFVCHFVGPKLSQGGYAQVHDISSSFRITELLESDRRMAVIYPFSADVPLIVKIQHHCLCPSETPRNALKFCTAIANGSPHAPIDWARREHDLTKSTHLGAATRLFSTDDVSWQVQKKMPGCELFNRIGSDYVMQGDLWLLEIDPKNALELKGKAFLQSLFRGNDGFVRSGPHLYYYNPDSVKLTKLPRENARLLEEHRWLKKHCWGDPRRDPVLVDSKDAGRQFPLGHQLILRSADPEKRKIIEEIAEKTQYFPRATSILTLEQRFLLGCATLEAVLTQVTEKNLCHGDIKPENLIVDDSGAVKVVDFGFACQLHEVKPFQGGSLPYTPPEYILDYEASYPVASRDVFSVGRILQLLFSGIDGSYLCDLIRLKEYWQKNSIDIDIDIDNFFAKLPPDQLAELKSSELARPLSRLIHRMLSKEPSQRPSMQEACSELKSVYDCYRQRKSDAVNMLSGHDTQSDHAMPAALLVVGSGASAQPSRAESAASLPDAKSAKAEPSAPQRASPAHIGIFKPPSLNSQRKFPQGHPPQSVLGAGATQKESAAPDSNGACTSAAH